MDDSPRVIGEDLICEHKIGNAVDQYMVISSEECGSIHGCWQLRTPAPSFVWPDLLSRGASF